MSRTFCAGLGWVNGFGVTLHDELVECVFEEPLALHVEHGWVGFVFGEQKICLVAGTKTILAQLVVLSVNMAVVLH